MIELSYIIATNHGLTLIFSGFFCGHFVDLLNSLPLISTENEAAGQMDSLI